MDPGLKILTAKESQYCDQQTALLESMNEHDLMERAAIRLFQHICKQNEGNAPLHIICGPGNNGGDGLCIAALAAATGLRTRVSLCCFGKQMSPAMQFRLKQHKDFQPLQIIEINNPDELNIQQDEIIIDAMFGTGLNSALQQPWDGLVAKINEAKVAVYSIDMPSGLFDNQPQSAAPYVNARLTLTVQAPKPTFFHPENNIVFEVVDCGINTDAITSSRYYLDPEYPPVIHQLKQLLPARPKHSHKGSFGHTLIIGGNYGMHGAAAIAAKACYDAGSGLTTVIAPSEATAHLSQLPGIMHKASALNKDAADLIQPDKYNSLAIGPGLGQTPETTALLTAILYKWQHPMVIDADALNIISKNLHLLEMVPAGSILTPHPKECERLFGPFNNSKEREFRLLQIAKKYNIYILAKDTYSLLACPEGNAFYNGTGSPKLARGGSGDKLTGMIAGLYAQSGVPRNAALAGMYFAGSEFTII